MTDPSAGPVEPKAITHRRVLAIAGPIVLSNATVPILGAVDTGVVGQLGEAAPIGAVGIGAVILTSVYWMFGFLRMGTTGLTSQALGSRNQSEVVALLTRALILGLGAGAFFILIQIPLFAGAFLLSPASAEVEALAADYMEIRIWSAPAMISLYGITGWLIAQERTRAVLVIQLLMNGMNILLDLLFVLEFGWGVRGVAVATFLSEWSGFALGVWLCRGAFATPAWKDWPRIFDRVRLINMARVNSDIMLRSFLLQAIFVSFLFWGGDFGDVPLAANQVLLQFLYITSYALDGFAFGAEALVGQALGARRREALRRSAYLTGLWGWGVGAGLALAFALFGPLVIDLMATAPEVQAEARRFLPWLVAAPLVGAPAWMLDGIFIGATRSRDMRNMMIVSAAGYFAAVMPLMALLANHGLWAALLLSFTLRGITHGSRYPALEAEADTPVSPAQ